MNYNMVGDAIVKHCGGLANFIHVTNCMTRVRMTIADTSLVDMTALKAIEGVLGVVEDDTLQVIVGPGKSTKVAGVINARLKGQPDSGEALSAVEQKAKTAREKAKKQTRTKVILKHIANIFVPILPALIAAGILMGLNNVIFNSAASWALTHHVASVGDLSPTQVVLDQRHLLGLSQFLDIVSKALFGFLAIYAGVTSAREFEGNLILGGLLGAITIMPQVTTFGLIPGQGGLIGVIFAVWLMCLLEKPVRRFVPDIVDVVVTPTLVLLVMAAALLFIIMPAAGIVSNGILSGLNGLLEHGGIVAGFVLSALFPFLISLGLHHGLFPIHLEMINATGHAPLFAIQIMSNAGMVGAATAVLLLTRDPVMKKIARGRSQPPFWRWVNRQYLASISPQDLRLLPALLAAGFGGVMVVLLGVSTNGVGAAGLSALPLIADGKYLQYILAWLVGCAAAFALTYIVGKVRGYDKETV